MDKKYILKEIKRTAEANGGVPLGVRKFAQETGIKDFDWNKHWSRWNDAIREAGFKPNQLQTAYNQNFVIEKFIGLVRELGRIPSRNDLRLKKRRDQTFPSDNVFINSLGDHSTQQAIKKVFDYCNSRSDYDDIIEMLRPIADEVRGEVARDETEPEVGFVYLVKSGRYYRIGRSNHAGRRNYELAIQMPERLIDVHTIRTDDPVGIVHYWLRRFADKNKNGDWFDLSAADIKAFKRRKFM